MKYIVYILQSLKDKRFYIGCTADIEERLRHHNSGRNRSTRSRRPLVLVYTEEFMDKHPAFQREFFLKSPKGFLEKRRILENLFNSEVAHPEGTPLGASSAVGDTEN